MQLHVYKTPGEVIDAAAQWITGNIQEVLQSRDRFTIALSGGETPKALYKLLASDTYKNRIDWTKMHIFWGDERFVPFTDENNNARMAFGHLLNNVDVPAENIHIMQTGIAPGLAAEEYDKILHRYFNDTPNSFDLVLLGMGRDGHTLSLFPSSPLLEERHKWASAVYVDDQKMYRLTLLPEIVNKASSILFLVTGHDKAGAIKEVLQGAPGKYPAQLIQPENNALHWFLDEDAARELQK